LHVHQRIEKQLVVLCFVADFLNSFANTGFAGQDETLKVIGTAFLFFAGCSLSVCQHAGNFNKHDVVETLHVFYFQQKNRSLLQTRNQES